MIVAATFALFAGLMLAIAVFGYYRFVQLPPLDVRLGGPVNEPDKRSVFPAPDEKAAFALLHKVGGWFPAGKQTATITQLLVNAGYPSARALPIYQGIRLLALGGGVLLSMAILPVDAPPAMRLLMMMGGAGMGFIVPDIILKRKAAERKECLRRSLPDALDLTIISVEAGLGLDQAIQYVATELHDAHRELSEELQLIGLEMRAGLRRTEALQAFANRTGEEEIAKLVGVLIQNDRFGTSMAESLRTHSQYLRTRQKQEAEEKATKVGVKLVFPIFLFIMPSMMIVAAGPSLLQIFKYMMPLMQQVR